MDSDEDGFGDVPMGAKRDDCPEVSGTSTKDLQGCIDSDGDGWSDEYGGWSSTIATIGENPASSWLTYLSLGVVMFISSGLAILLRSSKSAESFVRETGVRKGGEDNA